MTVAAVAAAVAGGPPGELHVRSLEIAPKPPRAGIPFVLSARLTEPADAARVRCEARAGRLELQSIWREAAGRRARCAWLLPGAAKGQRLRARVVVRLGGEVASARYAARIR